MQLSVELWKASLKIDIFTSAIRCDCRKYRQLENTLFNCQLLYMPANRLAESFLQDQLRS